MLRIKPASAGSTARYPADIKKPRFNGAFSYSSALNGPIDAQIGANEKNLHRFDVGVQA